MYSLNVAKDPAARVIVPPPADSVPLYGVLPTGLSASVPPPDLTSVPTPAIAPLRVNVFDAATLTVPVAGVEIIVFDSVQLSLTGSVPESWRLGAVRLPADRTSDAPEPTVKALLGTLRLPPLR